MFEIKFYESNGKWDACAECHRWWYLSDDSPLIGVGNSKEEALNDLKSILNDIKNDIEICLKEKFND